jgi:hypothetical protein
MDWIFDNIQIVAFVLIGIGSLVKTMLDSKANAKREAEAQENDPGEIFAPDEEYTIPRESNVPPPIYRRAIIEPARESGYEEAAAMEAAKALKHQQVLAERLRQIRETKATTTGGAAATRARVSARKTTQQTAAPALSIRARLRNPAELRRAFVMREILDVPVGLR